MAYEEFELKEGEWFRSTTFLMGLDYLLRRSPGVIGEKDLRVYNMNDNMLYLKGLFDLVYDPAPRESVKLGDLSGLKGCRAPEIRLEAVMGTGGGGAPGREEEQGKPCAQKEKRERGAEEKGGAISTGTQKSGGGQGTGPGPRLCQSESSDAEGALSEKKGDAERGGRKAGKEKGTGHGGEGPPRGQKAVPAQGPAERVGGPQPSSDFDFKMPSKEEQSPASKMSFSSSESAVSSGLEFETIAEYKAHLQAHEIDRPLLLCLNTMLGLSSIDRNHEIFLRRMFDLPSFVGMLGGKEYKAFYFFGYSARHFYYLDPHYVRSAHDEHYRDDQFLADYFQKTIFRMKYRSIAPSLSLCFLIESAAGKALIPDLLALLELAAEFCDDPCTNGQCFFAVDTKDLSVDVDDADIISFS